MSCTCLSLSTKVLMLSALLLGACPAHAQSPVRTPPAFGIHPSDKGFQIAMKIQSYYQALARAAPIAVSRTVVPSAVHAEPLATPVTISIAQPAARPETVTIRGPGGDGRSYPVGLGRRISHCRTVVLRPGEKLFLVIGTTQAQVGK